MGRLITLLDMEQYPVENIVHIMARIDFVKEDCAFHIGKNTAWPDEARNKVRGGLREALPWLSDMDLLDAKDSCDQLEQAITHLEPRGSMAKADSARDTLTSQLKKRVFFVLNKANGEYYENFLLAGQRFKDNWPKANEELKEAGNCFALNCYTACVCHLMRSLEHALKAFEKALNITAPSPGPGNTWGDIIGRILPKKGKLGSAANPPSPEWALNPNFYDNCLTFFCAVKSACRDKTFHVEASYDKASAKLMLNCTISVLEKISEHLNEIK